MADLFRVLNAQQDVFLRANIVVAVDDETADQEVFLGRAKMKELMAGALAIEVSQSRSVFPTTGSSPYLSTSRAMSTTSSRLPA